MTSSLADHNAARYKGVMTGKNDRVERFLAEAQAACNAGTFVRLVLSGYRGAESGLVRIELRPVLVKAGEKFALTRKYRTRDTAENLDLQIGWAFCQAALTQKEFQNAVLFTTAFDLAYPALKKTAARSKAEPSLSHDRPKARLANPSNPAYKALGLTDTQGRILKSAQDKFRQIDRYVRTVSDLLEDVKTPPEHVVDMGAGKGYLTFALYEFLRTKNPGVVVTGIEMREDLVEKCNTISRDCGYRGLGFVQGAIATYPLEKIDMLVALHACDTATDDAIAWGIASQARIIVVAPCCHKQVRAEMERSNMAKGAFGFMLRHGVFMERQAEMVTDALRALYLEEAGYKVKAFEFVSDSHTPKNVMITAIKAQQKGTTDKTRITIEEAKTLFGVAHHALDDRLNPRARGKD